MYAINMYEHSKNKNTKGITVKIDKDVYTKIGSIVSTGRIREFVNDTLLMNIERMRLLDRYHTPFLSLVSLSDDSLFVKDTNIKKIVEVKLSYTKKEDKITLRCLDENSDNCVHVAFSLGLPELGKLSSSLLSPQSSSSSQPHSHKP